MATLDDPPQHILQLGTFVVVSLLTCLFCQLEEVAGQVESFDMEALSSGSNQVNSLTPKLL